MTNKNALTMTLPAVFVFCLLTFASTAFGQVTNEQRGTQGDPPAGQQEDKGKSKEEKDAEKVVGRIIWTTTCEPTVAESAFVTTLIGVFAPKVIDAGLSLLSNKLSDLQNSYSKTYVGSISDSWGTGNIDMIPGENAGDAAQPNLNLSISKRCVIFYSGRYGTWGDHVSSSKRASAADAEKAFYPVQIQELDYRPALFLMAKTDYRPVGDRGVVYKIDLLKFAANGRSSRRSSSSDYVISIEHKMPEVVTTKAYSAKLAFPPLQDVAKGQHLEFDSVTTDWTEFPKISGEAEEQFILPATVAVTVVETREGVGPVVYGKLKEAVDENKDELSAAVLKVLGLGDDEDEASDDDDESK